MNRPALVIMAAGMGSRFGGLKQIEPVDEQGHIIMDFSLFDAYRAGFRDLVFIIKPELEQSFPESPIKSTTKSELEGQTTRNIPGSVSFVPSVAGLVIAGHVIKKLCGI